MAEVSVPLGFIFPALLHYKACARTRTQKLADLALLVFGVAAAVFSTSQTVSRPPSGLASTDGANSLGGLLQINLLVQAGESRPPTFGQCPPRE